MSEPIDWNYYISDKAKLWAPSPIRSLLPLEKIPGMISLFAGKPNEDTFPFESISVQLKPVGDASPEKLVIEGDELAHGLQYTATAGFDDFVDWLKELQLQKHSCAKDSYDLSLGNGSQDLISKAFASLINPGDSILLETPVYAGILGLLGPEPVNLVEVPTDTKGLVPEELEKTLENWSRDRPNERFPKVLYTIPTGSNPTGSSIPLDRKIKVLEIAQKYKLLILEDDAYYYLHFDKSNQPPSYFELDGKSEHPGRVIRFDSFSKILSAGMRLGWMSGHPDFVKVICLHTANTNLQPNSLSQTVALALLKKWGHVKFLQHVEQVSEFYQKRCKTFEALARKHLDGLATWVSPDAGMFLFLKLNIPGSGDSDKLISQEAFKKGVLAVPGVYFMPSKSVSSYVRTSFSLPTDEQMDLAFARLRECLLEIQENK